GGFPPVAGPDPVRPGRAGRLGLVLAGAVAAIVCTVFAAVVVLQSTTGRDRRVETRVLPASITRLVVDGGGSDVFLYGPGETAVEGVRLPAGATTSTSATPPAIEVVARLAGFVRLPTLDTRVDGDTVRVSRRCRPFWDCSATLYLRVPAGVRVDADTSEGSIAAAGLDGPVRLHATGGDVTVDRPGGDLEATSSAGDVHIADSHAQRVDASTSAGDVFLDAATAPDDITLHTAAGSVEVYLPPDAPSYHTDLHTSAGTRDVSIGRDPHAPRRLSASTFAGDITVGYRDGS
ncbi:DUF4097 family beta strand repeat-containing protein, partial [Frankia sp. AgKG'84/4]|uniref:DUF4097 family beta strand repeat-containing protein n=1 Tax=Frankia sp. AgKG'84/4 TaxID=573490 RepID=UPI002029EFD6